MPTPGADFSFAKVIAPCEPEVFFRDYYEKKPLILRRDSPRYYDGLASLDMIDSYLTTTQPRTAAVSLFKNDQAAKPEDYSNGDRRVDPVAALRFFHEGWTIVLTQMQSHFPGLAALCRSAEAEFSGQFKTNLYLTPAGAQGFAAHWDTHDVFALQVSGSKAWSLYDTQVELPLRGQAREKGKDKPGALTREFTLRAGDMLYCPRGLIHDARSTDEVSLHITCGLLARTWADLILESVAAIALRRPELRRNLPRGFARDGFDASVHEAEFRAMLGLIAKHAPLKPVFDLMAEQFVASRPPLATGQMRQLLALPELTARARLGARPGLVWRIVRGQTAMSLFCQGVELTLPAFALDAVRFAMATAEFTSAQLPGDFDEEGKLTLARRLITEGFVRALDAE